MAFLCPTGFSVHKRRRRSKIQNVPNERTKIAVSEFEPTKMIVVRDFIPCVTDELKVRRGEYVKALYQENEWRYVINEDGNEGFVPYTYCIPVSTQHETYDRKVTALQYELLGNKSNKSNSTSSEVALQEFIKRDFGVYIVLFDYSAVEEDDINAFHGEKVLVLNKDDADWFWVKSIDGEKEGFIPRQYLEKVQETIASYSVSNTTATHSKAPMFQSNDNASSFEVNKLIVIRDFISHGEQELTIKRGQEILTDDDHIEKQPWIWAYSPQTRRSGFIPSSAIKWSQNTTFL